MNTNRSTETEETLRKALRQWTVDTPLPPCFQEQVWQRIARAESKAEAATWPGLWRLVEVVLPHPKFAFAYLASLMVLGVTAGSWAAQVKTNRLDSALSLRYVQSIDPYLAEMSHP